jgi:hypothetical protein
MNKVLLCTDLDRTLIPNGSHPESPQARALFSQLVNSGLVTLVYVSGRDVSLIQHAIEEYHLPLPDYAIADVGSTIYHRENSTSWRRWGAWDEKIDDDWQGRSIEDLHSLISDIDPLQRQEPQKQALHKLSYYVELGHDHHRLMSHIETRLKDKGIHANLIWSLDEVRNIGLLDILPLSANKLHAITFLMNHEGYAIMDTVFFGDSGNDLDVLLSPIPSVLVANADDEVRAAVKGASPDTLYIANGSFLNMNGCYSAGILEGIAHYRPEFVPVLKGFQ